MFSDIKIIQVLLIYSTFVYVSDAYGYHQNSSFRSHKFFLAAPVEPVLNVNEMNYTVVVVSSKINCLVNCASRENCGHAVHCGDLKSCYLDVESVNYCGSKFEGCKCFATNSWASQNQGVGAWIKIYLDQLRVLVGVRVMQRPFKSGRNKDVRLEFSDDSAQELPYHDKHGLFWDNVGLKRVETSWVNITILSVYAEKNNGWKEIELYS